MPPSDVRRSARGAPTTAKPPPPASTASSSSLSSNRQDRNTRLANNQKSATPHSLSSEDISEPPRRSQRSHQPKEVEASKEPADADEEAVDEEEITRCICGQQDYPGPPLSEAFQDVDTQADDGGLFISCDGCSVWQHGGCVGIIEEGKVPDKYYCEECRPKLHELHTDENGQRYSLYQPVHGKSTRKASMSSKHGDKASREREALRASAEAMGSGRRRGTMRSKEHDDEEEQFRRAIEESKRELDPSGKKSGKRGREESEDNKASIKRQRTTSESVPTTAATRKYSHDPESEDETSALTGKKAKAEAAHSSRQADAREKELERANKRAEAAGRRQERAGRRRGDDEPADETPKPSTSAKASPPPSSQPESPAETNGEKVVGTGTGRRGGKKKKLGNNQYTNASRSASSPHSKKRAGGLSSGEENLANGDSHADSATNTRKSSPDAQTTTGVVGGVATGVGKGKFGKGKKALNGNGGAKAEDPADLTMATMRRRMEAMSSFIVRAQLELTGASADKTPGSQSPATFGPGGAVQAPARSTPSLAGPVLDEKDHKDMSAMEMADVVSRSIEGWRARFADLV